MAAVLAVGPGAALSHRCAAALHELRRYEGNKVDVTIPLRSARVRPGIQIRRSITLTSADVTTVDNIPCTTVARTLFDLADIVSRRPLERAFDQAQIIDALNVLAIEDQLGRNRTRPAAGKVQAILTEHYVGSTPTWTELEDAFLALCRARALPQPAVNEFIVLPDGGPAIRADFVFRAQRVVVETDSRTFHLTNQAFEQDRDRDQRLSAYAWRPFRATWLQIISRPEIVGTRLEALLALAG
jgi:hypothetical protein